MQGMYGDNHKPQPSYLDLVERLKWNAWTGKKGMDRHQARMEFMDMADKVLKEHGFSAENPDEARINAEYDKCVAKKLASGVSQEEIEAETNAFVKEK